MGIGDIGEVQCRGIVRRHSEGDNDGRGSIREFDEGMVC